METKNATLGAQTSSISLGYGQALSIVGDEAVVLEAQPRRVTGTSGARALSKREQDVLYWLAQGKSGQETSIILGISLCTVRVHIRNMLKKLDASNIPHAVTRAYQRGILSI